MLIFPFVLFICFVYSCVYLIVSAKILNLTNIIIYQAQAKHLLISLLPLPLISVFAYRVVSWALIGSELHFFALIGCRRQSDA